jgi:dienelactone hydrolase
MKELELTFASLNSENYPKRITAYATLPDRPGETTGLMHVAHGWGGNRYQYRDMQREFADRYDLVCVATEYRQSGYDFDATTGSGAYRPYDASHYQVFDCLNTVRVALDLYPGLDRRRIIAFGGSQGAHITMLMTVFAPDTFALAVAACGIGRMDPDRVAWTGRHMSEDELAVRDAVAMADRVKCPVVLMHGTADETVPDVHTRNLEAALRRCGVEVIAKYYEGGGHSLAPATNRRDATVELADGLLREARRDGPTDFDKGSRIVVPCPARTFVVDWSRPPEDPDLISWERAL